MAKNLDNSKNIINYLKFQRINFNRELPRVLEKYSYDLQEFKNLKKKDKDLITKDIKQGIEIFKDMGENYNINYLNYILILESLPNDKLKNLYRFFSFRWNNLLNEDENLGTNKSNYKFKHPYRVVYHSSNPKKLLLETLEDLKKKRDISIIYFIGCMNQFTT
jgi:cAMP phosphodiesterase